MTALQTSAEFAAYLWYINQPEHNGQPRTEAQGFARREWERFLPNANEGFGRLIKKIAKGQTSRTPRADRPVVVAA